ncbi:MAG: Ig-like domain-containing protein [bacterium]|nr:Ig-like domain-containing protein [bacterium]
MKWIVAILALGLALACAKQGFPPGGPEDKTPPSVLETVPGPGTVNVPLSPTVEIRFTEPVKPGPSGEAVFISPFEGRNAVVKWKGSRLRIRFREPLKPNCTYVVTLGSSIRDYRNNKMDSSFTLAFSTGPALDRGEIAGRVFASGDAGADVWAYRLDGTGDGGSDPDPAVRPPDYIVQAAADGAFRFRHVAPVRYRLFAVRDRAGDRLYQPGEDEIGVPSRDLDPDPAGGLRADSCFLRPSRREPGVPALQAAAATDRNHLSVRFDRWLTAAAPIPENGVVISAAADSSDRLAVRAAYLNRENPRELFVVTADQEGKKPYRFLLRTDWTAAHPDTAWWKATFDGSGRPDTTRPKLLKSSPAFRERAFNPLAPVRLTFDEAMDTSRFSSGFTLSDTSGRPVDGLIRWTDPAEALFTPAAGFAGSTDYELRLTGPGAADACGNALADTLIPFRTSTADTLSEIAGTVRLSRPGPSGSFFVTAVQASSPGLRYTVRAADDGVYRIRECLPGPYLLDCFLDRDGDGVWSAGSAFPFEPSEPFVVYRDTVRARSRWPNEGNDLTLP